MSERRINEHTFITRRPSGPGFGEQFRSSLPGMTEGSITIRGLTKPPPEMQMPILTRLTPDLLAQFPPIEVGQVITLTRGGEDFQFRVDRIDGPGELWLWLLVDEESP